MGVSLEQYVIYLLEVVLALGVLGIFAAWFMPRQERENNDALR